MYIFQVATIFLSVAGYVTATEHRGEKADEYRGSTGDGPRTVVEYVIGDVSRGRDESIGGGENLPSQAYSFVYRERDEPKNVSSRQSQGDKIDAVGGYYGYRHVNGLYRNIQYTFDAGGFKAASESNDPGAEDDRPNDPSVTDEHESGGQQDGFISPWAGKPGGYIAARASKEGSYRDGAKQLRGGRTRRNVRKKRQRARNRSRPLNSGRHWGGGGRNRSGYQGGRRRG